MVDTSPALAYAGNTPSTAPIKERSLGGGGGMKNG